MTLEFSHSLNVYFKQLFYDIFSVFGVLLK